MPRSRRAHGVILQCCGVCPCAHAVLCCAVLCCAVLCCCVRSDDGLPRVFIHVLLRANAAIADRHRLPHPPIRRLVTRHTATTPPPRSPQCLSMQCGRYRKRGDHSPLPLLGALTGSVASRENSLRNADRPRMVFPSERLIFSDGRAAGRANQHCIIYN